MISANKVLVLMAGGTIAQTIGPDGRMAISRTVGDLVGQTGYAERVDTENFAARPGANLTVEMAHAIASRIVSAAGDYRGFVLVMGTDSMEELAFLLDLVIDIEEPVVLTGAMKPSDVVGYDGIANLIQAIEIAGDEASRRRGVLIAMNDQIHVARYVRKADTQLMGAFVSHPGPVGEVRRGRVTYYYGNTRSPDRFAVSDLVAMPLDIRIVTFGFDQPFHDSLAEGAAGLVVAGMGTASISDAWIDSLSPHWTNRLPVVLVSRTMRGANFNDFYYRGSLIKYEERGFLMTDYVDLNPMQARLRLALSLAAREGS